MGIEVKKINEFKGHMQAVYTLLANLLNPKIFYSGGADGLLVEWNTDNPQEGQVIVQIKTPIYSFAFVNQYLWVGCSTGNVHIIDLEARKEVKNYQLNSGAIFDIKYEFPCGIFIATAQGKLFHFQEDGSILAESIISNKPLREIYLLASKNILYIACSDHSIYEYSIPEKRIINIFSGSLNSVFCLEYLDPYLISGGRDARIRIWDSINLTEINHINAHWYTINGLKLNPSKKLLASSSLDKSIKIWECPEIKLIKVIDLLKNQGHSSSVNRLIWLDEENLISSSDDRNIIQWKISLNDN